MKPCAAALALALAACNNGFDHQYLVTDLRVLSIHVEVQGSGVDPDGVTTATQADGIPGDMLERSALVANPTGRAGVAVRWYGCLPTPDETLPPCADPAFLSDPSRLDNAADKGVLPLGTCSPVDGVCSVTVPLPAASDPTYGTQVQSALDFILSIAVNDLAYRCRLYADMPIVAVAVADGRRDVALKRVRITPSESTILEKLPEDPYVVNHNPIVQEIVRAPTATDGSCGGGTAVTPVTFPAGQTVLCGEPPDVGFPGTAETFNVCVVEMGSDGNPVLTLTPTSEHFSWQWFTTGGEFPDFGEGIGNATGKSLSFVRPPDPFTLWAILRDGRGGEVWFRQKVCSTDGLSCPP